MSYMHNAARHLDVDDAKIGPTVCDPRENTHRRAETVLNDCCVHMVSTARGLQRAHGESEHTENGTQANQSLGLLEKQPLLKWTLWMPPCTPSPTHKRM